MVSGIGPKETLKKYNIPVLSDIPGVGQGLQDQPLYALIYNVSVITTTSLRNATYAAQAVQDYLSNQTGPLTNPGTNEIGKLYSNVDIQSLSLKDHRVGEAPQLISSKSFGQCSLRPFPISRRLARS